MLILIMFIVLLVAIPGWAQLYPSDPPLLGPLQNSAYGPGLNSDATGRPFYWKPEGQEPSRPDPIIQPEVNKWGYGASGDQFGRRIVPSFEPEIEQTEPFRGSNRRLQWGPGNNHDTE